MNKVAFKYAFKLYEKILDGRLGEVVDIDKMQYRFMSGRGTVDAVFVLRRLTEKFRAKNKLFFLKLGFAPCEAEEPLRGMALHEKEAQKDQSIQEI